jgi:cystathionine beta-lyase
MACTIPLLTFARPGGHVLAVDSVYGPTRRFIDRVLSRFGVQATYFPADIGGAITNLIRPETQVMFVESPGSLTFEVADAPALAKAARAAGIITVMDNTWSAGVFHKPLQLGFDVSVQATTKYISGGADVLSGAMYADDGDIADQLENFTRDVGSNVSADDAFTVLRGARSLPLRMQHHQMSAIAVATWLSDHRHVARVFHPALPGAVGHEIWRRDFTGSSGLFSIALKATDSIRVHAFLDTLDLFGLGFSYGGFESLAIHCNPQLKRSAREPDAEEALIRLSIGLEDPSDLIVDLDEALRQLD